MNMDVKLIISKLFGKVHFRFAVVLSFAGGAAIAAALFVANSQPWGYIAPAALSSTDFSHGDVVAYTPWFEDRTFRGDLVAFPVDPSTATQSLTPVWRAAAVLDSQNFLTGRRIVTTDGFGNAMPFNLPELTAGQQLSIGSEAMLNFIRGDRSNESSSGLRVRNSVLGDIVHSTPVYVGKPSAGYNDEKYLSFASSNAGRDPQVYVGANDGMLHAFDAKTGTEVFAFIPSTIISNLTKLAAQPYKHQYFVDGFITVEDAFFADAWHTTLVSGLGAGGKGFFALDISVPGATTEAEAASKVLWEFHGSSSGAGNLGYGYSRPSIVSLANDSWAAVVGNGYLSSTGVASLYVLDAGSGSVIREIVVPDMDANGLSSPTMIDSNTDGIVDTAYAGDLNGNLWKFDLSSPSPAAWSVAYSGQPLFRTAVSGTVRQPITTAPEVGRHPAGGVLVYVGTGRLLSPADGVDKSEQAVYGIWDNNWGTGVPIDLSQLLRQKLIGQFHSSGKATRTATAHVPDWGTHRGWVTPTVIVGATSLDQGERVIQDLILRDGRVSFITINPTIPTGENWFIQLDSINGGGPGKVIVDVNSDLLLDIMDNVDGNGDGVIKDARVDRVIGEYQEFGLASRPIIGILDTDRDTALINHLIAISPNETIYADDPGLLGGHFDLDTASAIYPFGGGTTDAHVHQWDDKNDLTTIDYLDIAGDEELTEINHAALGIGPDDVFMLTVANNALSPGGVLEINGTSLTVGDYRGLVDRYLAGLLLPGETFPLYKLSAPTATEAANGVIELGSLKLSFDAFAILSGDLVPTSTGCVRANDPGALGEYRNGALLLQALDGNSVSGGFVYDSETQRYVSGSTAIHSSLGYATDGLLWESTVFWHWDGGCYGDQDWDDLYESCVIQGGGECIRGSKEKKDKGKKKKKKGGDDGHGDPGSTDSSGVPVQTLPDGSINPVHTLTKTTIGGSNDAGRIFWREMIPQ